MRYNIAMLTERSNYFYFYIVQYVVKVFGQFHLKNNRMELP
jgi:hypothetical protein